MADYPKWNFDYQAQEKASFQALRPYYEKMLEYAGGDLKLAKERLAFTYTSGMRETASERELKAREMAITYPQEQEQQITGLNQRGLAGGVTEAQLKAGEGGGLAGTEAGRLKESQAIRKEAIDRALQERETGLIKEKEFGTEEVETGYAKEKQQLGRTHQQEAEQMAMRKMQVEQAKYGAQVGEFTAEQQRKAMTAGSSAFTPYSTEGKTTAQMYAESGRQSELDALRKAGYNI